MLRASSPPPAPRLEVLGLARPKTIGLTSERPAGGSVSGVNSCTLLAGMIRGACVGYLLYPKAPALGAGG